jgi:hypothetical protein
VHAVLGKEGVSVPVSDLFGVAGRLMFDNTPMGEVFARRVTSTRIGTIKLW